MFQKDHFLITDGQVKGLNYCEDRTHKHTAFYPMLTQYHQNELFS